jgi:hypothetical protein
MLTRFSAAVNVVWSRYHVIFFEIQDQFFPKDSHGHGTHTASIATGNPINMSIILGLAQGTAKDGTPSARIVVY